VIVLCGCSVVEFFTGWGMFRCGKNVGFPTKLERF
jgi:hypothetical protein